MITPGAEAAQESPGLQRGRRGLTLGLLVSMLYHRIDAQAFGIWQMLEITTTGKEWVCRVWGTDRE